MNIVIATKNQHKLNEIKRKFKQITNIHIQSINQYNIPDIEETGTTFAENAMIKAKTVAAITGEISLADDSGLVVDTLNGQPGIKSARYGGPGLTDQDRNNLLLKQLTDIPDKERTAHFICVIAIIDPHNNKTYLAEGICDGIITRQPQGLNGFGYDPVFWVAKFNKTMAELPLEIKNSISHRALALEKALNILQTINQQKNGS